MYQVSQCCRFLSWTGTMTRCHWCILGLHAHAIYSDVISFCTKRVLFGNTVDHFRRSWSYYSFSTQLWSFEPIWRQVQRTRRIMSVDVTQQIRIRGGHRVCFEIAQTSTRSSSWWRGVNRTVEDLSKGQVALEDKTVYPFNARWPLEWPCI